MEGYTKFENNMLECLYSINLTTRQLKVFLYIVRWVIGYQKQRRALSVAIMASDTGIDRRHIASIIKELEERKMIKVFRNGQGSMSLFEVLPVKTWRKHAPVEAQVEDGKTCAAGGASHAPVEAQVHAPVEAHNKENSKDNSKESKEREPVQVAFEDDDEEATHVALERYKKEHGYL